MKILLAGGGTAGHINPALAIADCIKAHHPKAQIAFVGNKDSMEERIISHTGYQFYTMKVRGFQRSLSLQNIKRNIEAVWCLGTAGAKSRQILQDFAPDLVIGTGGYVSGPILQSAAKMNIKTAIHEQNAYPGITNKILSKQVDVVLLAVKQAKEYMDPNAHCVVVGNPIRQSILEATYHDSRKKLKIKEDEFLILSFGGSLGAEKINQVVGDLVAHTVKTYKNVRHIHAYGGRGKEVFMDKLAQNFVDSGDCRLDIREYINNMDICLAASDLIISRAGAITLSEIQAAGKAAILIPSPYVSENHQYHNAMVLQNQGSALVVEEKDLNANAFCTQVDDFIKNPNTATAWGIIAQKNAITDASERIYNICMSLLA